MTELYEFWCPDCSNRESIQEAAPTRCKKCGSWMSFVRKVEPPKGSKFDQGKPRWGLLPWTELETVVEVLTMGAEKYSDDNWKHVEPFESRYRDALMRHFSAYCKGETKDPESGKSHLAHAVCCALFLMWKENQ